MHTFYQTLQIVSGILVPVLLVLLIRLGIELSQERRARHDRKRKEAEKLPPFDHDAEFYEVPNDSMIGVRLKKDGEIVWEGAVDKLSRNDTRMYLRSSNE